MTSPEKKLEFLLRLSRVQSQINRRFDGTSGWFGWSGFQVLYYLNRSQEKRMRRIDLAEKLALTASGITRMLLPMEKLGLVEREACQGDARVSYVKLTSAGQRVLGESMENVLYLASELMPKENENKKTDPEDFFRLFSLGHIAD